MISTFFFFLNISHFLISGSWLFLCAGRVNLGHPAFRSSSAALVRALVEAPVTARGRRDLSPGVGVLLNAQRPGEPFGVRFHQVPPAPEVYTSMDPVGSSQAFWLKWFSSWRGGGGTVFLYERHRGACERDQV